MDVYIPEYKLDPLYLVIRTIPLIPNISTCMLLFMSADTSLEPRPILTQASDLLVKIDLPVIELSKDIRIRARLLPENELNDPVEFNVDGTFSGVSTFYLFIPASEVPDTFRRFWIQIALIVNNVKGPFSPPEVTSTQFVGKHSTCNHHFCIPMSTSYCTQFGTYI